MCNILSWNIRGSRSSEKAKLLRRLVRKKRPVIVALQETKRGGLDHRVLKQLWGNKPHGWAEVPSIGASGGMVIIWDSLRLQALEILKGDYSLSVRFKDLDLGEEWAFTNVYGPVNPSEKIDFWSELSNVGGYWDIP
ncbi:hypothetical protein ACHQM5_017921 [Ranunculus cassubicifolius]